MSDTTLEKSTGSQLPNVEKDVSVEALGLLHDDLKETARHHETLSLTIIGAQIAVMAGAASIWKDADEDLRIALSVGHVLCNLAAVLLLYAHFRGRRAHISIARLVRPQLTAVVTRSLASDAINGEYEKQFGGSGSKDPTYVALLGMAYDWLPLCFGGLILSLSTFLALCSGWKSVLGVLAAVLAMAALPWIVLEATKKKREARASAQAPARPSST